MARKRDGAGIMLIAGGMTLLLQRSNLSSHPGTWAPPGGRIDPGENEYMAAQRETKEEAGINVGNFYITNKYTQPLVEEEGNYTTFVIHTVIMPDAFDVKIDHESMGWGWFSVEEMRALPLHPGFHKVLEYLNME